MSWSFYLISNIIFMKNNKIWKCIENFSSILLPLIWVCLCVVEMGAWGGGGREGEAVNLTFCSINELFIRESSDINQKLDGFISNFRNSGQILYKKNCHNSRTSEEIEMKFEPGTKLGKRTRTTWKKLTMTSVQQNTKSSSFSGWMVYDSYVFINSSLLSYKKSKQK